MKLEKFIRDVPDFPKPGIIFKDITTLLKNPKAFKNALNQMYKAIKDQKIDIIVGLESRGFIFAPHLAYKCGAGFVPIRKPNKLPAEKVAQEYITEYSTDKIEIHKDAIQPGQKVLIVDDLLATGGTAKAAADLVKKLGGELTGILFLIELAFLKGREKLPGENVIALLKY